MESFANFDFEIENCEIDVDFGKVYESGGSGLEETIITISFNSYTVVE